MVVDAVSPASTVHLLGHGDYAVMMTAAGAGYSQWKDLAVTRWHAERAGGEPGGFVYLRDIGKGSVWSATARPCGGETRTWCDEAMFRCARRDGAITTTLEVAVDPDRPVEVRGIGVRNHGAVACTLELTSYVELVLGSRQADETHPAYSKMFVQTVIEDVVMEQGVLLAWRRKKDPSEPDVWAAHALVVDGDEAGAREWETDRARFIGRDGSLVAPAALQNGQNLSGTVGTVLDPVFSWRTRLSVEAGATRRAALVTAVAASRNEVLALLRKYSTAAACADVFTRAAAGATPGDAHDRSAAQGFQRLAGALLYDDPALRSPPAIRANGEGGAPVLWAKGISGDLPIALARVADNAGVGLADELLQAQRWWRARQLPADLVVLDASSGATAGPVAAALQKLVDAHGPNDKPQGSLFVLRETDLDARLRAGLYAVARIVLDGSRGDLTAQLGRLPREMSARFAPPLRSRARGGQPASLPKPAELDFWNGIGGFTRDGREYVTVLSDGASTPAPWSHIVANPDFGFLVTTTGGGYAWAGNSQQNQVTAWSNDAVCDPPGDAFLLRDRDDGTEWSATASPLRAGGTTYVARFGSGYARFDTNVHGIESELTQCVAAADPVKLSRLRLRNRSGRVRRIAVAQTVAWRLGAIGSDPCATTLLECDATGGAVFARNPWRDGFTQATAFMACSAHDATVGNGAGMTSAAVATVELAPDAETEILFLLGEGTDRAVAQALVDRHWHCDFESALMETTGVWDGVQQALQVSTPDRSLDLLANRCLPYQVLACRVWARTAFYQASGAFGFRDQLQDVGALCIARPDLVRAHILLSASRQFEEGDVQHWWLPPSGKGVRTRMVDDRLWLPYIAAHYIETTGDTAILDEQVPFVHGDALRPGQVDSFFAPAVSAQTASLFEHCARAIDASLASGVHGLPLMGTGDWNDGMNRVGIGGKGESVWMGWFLYKVVVDFAPHAERRGDPRSTPWRDHVRALQLALETKAWDGDWYRRAFYDDGTPLGSAADTECRVESMAQSWAVISGAGDPERARHAMQAVNQHLVRSNDGLVALFTQPFDKTAHDPGYIKGYPPGLRENGGQYTHGSIWSLVAFAMLGDGDKAGELLEIFNPIRHSDSPEKLARYKVEPYVECADVYSVAPHVGRGGWTWYSGSAGWLYRALVEWVLGFHLRGDSLYIDPCIPHAWQRFALDYRHGRSRYHIEVENPDHVCRGLASIEVDGVTLQGSRAGIALVDDGVAHHVRVILHKEASR